MALSAAARAFKVLLARLGVAGLQILGRDAAPAARMRLGRGFARADERDEAANLRRRKFETGHLVVRPAVADDLRNLFASGVGLHQRGFGEVGPGLSPHGIAAMTE